MHYPAKFLARFLKDFIFLNYQSILYWGSHSKPTREIITCRDFAKILQVLIWAKFSNALKIVRNKIKPFE